DARAGAFASNNGSMRTVPVNQSAGPLLDGCEPILLISMSVTFVKESPSRVRDGQSVFVWQIHSRDSAASRLQSYSATRHLLELFRIASSLHGDLRGCVIALPEIVIEPLYHERATNSFRSEESHPVRPAFRFD